MLLNHETGAKVAPGWSNMRHLKDFEFIEGVIRAGSIRKASEDLNITASALNRRINRFEDEFGYEIFERLPRGVRLNPAGELLLHHIRANRSDFARLKSQVSDLSGVRRGHVSIACSQALLPYFLPREIARYRGEHPGVTFSVNARDRVAAERELSEFASDIALVFEPLTMVDFEVVYAMAQPIYAIMPTEHPLAEQSEIRLRDALRFPHVAPSEKFAVRVLLDSAARRLTSTELDPLIQSESFDFMRHYGEWENMISFQFPIGLDMDRQPNLVARPMAICDVAPGNLLLGQLRGRTLPVASARFMRELINALRAMPL
ncbi:LysR family transcriptional regulator [Roseobacter sp.]|uniref:LysR family transcriptional regulator n=1 Tax=Roseobacter sp. TaxID=1907202 RepID=UPI00385F58DA